MHTKELFRVDVRKSLGGDAAQLAAEAVAECEHAAARREQHQVLGAARDGGDHLAVGQSIDRELHWTLDRLIRARDETEPNSLLQTTRIS